MSLTYFSEIDNSTSPHSYVQIDARRALRPQSPEVRALLPGDVQKSGRHEFGRHERAPTSFPQN